MSFLDGLKGQFVKFQKQMSEMSEMVKANREEIEKIKQKVDGRSESELVSVILSNVYKQH